MTYIANLADLYEAVFQEPPSALTRGSLVAMAYAFRITDNDPLGPVIVMSMRSTDLLDASLRQRSADELKHRERLRELNGELDGLLNELASARNHKWWSRPRTRNKDMDAPPIRVDIHRHASPLASYLGHAFLKKNGVCDQDDWVAAARTDLLLLIAFVLTCAGSGAAIFKVMSGT